MWPSLALSNKEFTVSTSAISIILALLFFLNFLCKFIRVTSISQSCYNVILFNKAFTTLILYPVLRPFPATTRCHSNLLLLTYLHLDHQQGTIALSSNMYYQATGSLNGDNSTFSSSSSIMRAIFLEAVEHKASTIPPKHISILIITQILLRYLPLCITKPRAA